MSEIKALDKLRDAWQGIGGETSCAGCYYKIEGYIDEIEAEIADNYMRLPCDADGVPIHVGDEVIAISTGEFETVSHVSEKSIEIERFGVKPSSVRHVKPRTLEDVLNDRINDVLRVMTSGIGIALETALNDSFGEECADEIRELLLGGDES